MTPDERAARVVNDWTDTECREGHEDLINRIAAEISSAEEVVRQETIKRCNEIRDCEVRAAVEEAKAVNDLKWDSVTDKMLDSTFDSGFEKGKLKCAATHDEMIRKAVEEAESEIKRQCVDRISRMMKVAYEDAAKIAEECATTLVFSNKALMSMDEVAKVRKLQRTQIAEAIRARAREVAG